MGLMEMLGGLLGKSKTDGVGGVSEDSAMEAVAGMLGSGGGGLGSMLEKLKAGGLGGAADSWVGTGENKAVSGDQVKSALGEDAIMGVAKKLGLPSGAAATAVAAALPKIIDKLTPDGTVPDAGALMERFGGLLKK
ncbi:MAG: YidB family protein [Thermoleophilia bacterium]